jgi:hypothetical protein
MEFVYPSIYRFVMQHKLLLLLISFVYLSSCSGNSPGSVKDTTLKATDTTDFSNTIAAKNKLGVKTIHVFVALCDNKYQGIVPVPAAIGNGQNAATNLYWGAAYGVKTFFGKSSEWRLVELKKNPAVNILERILFKHKTKNIYLLADAYDGQYIKQATIDFLFACSGKGLTTIKANENEIPFGAASDIVAYVGHDGLMDFSLPDDFKKQNELNRKTIMLACKSKQFFGQHIKATGAEPLLWTTGLMAPEAYILHDAINAWIKSGDNNEVRQSAAAAYSKYQKCSMRAAQNLLVSGW